MSYGAATIWAMIAVLGIGTYAIRFSFLGLLGGRTLPPWALRMLRYVPVAVLPGIAAAPLAADGGAPPLHLLAVAAALGAGVLTRGAVSAAAAGALVLAAGSLL